MENGIALSEFKPFVTLDLVRHNEKPYNVAVQKQKLGEQIQIWPYDCHGKTYYVAIYAKSFFPPRFHLDGFLILTKSGEIVQEREFCLRTVCDFLVWQRLYNKAPLKYAPKQYFDTLRKMSNLALDNCARAKDTRELHDL